MGREDHVKEVSNYSEPFQHFLCYYAIMPYYHSTVKRRPMTSITVFDNTENNVYNTMKLETRKEKIKVRKTILMV